MSETHRAEGRINVWNMAFMVSFHLIAAVGVYYLSLIHI